MGILDDAIREHLDLKRRLGADSGELQRLEDEAFGPPTRPGEPDFPDQAAAEGEAAESDLSGGEAVATEEPPAEPQPLPPEPAASDLPPVEPSAETATPTSEPDAEPAVAESLEAPIESLDTVEHHFEGAIEDTGDAPAVEEAVTGEEPLTGEEPITGEEPVTGEEPLTGEEPVTGEAPLTGEEEVEVVEGEVTNADEEEDVLEETPEFLRDAPEDDELWFEQGEPKDFDF